MEEEVAEGAVEEVVGEGGKHTGDMTDRNKGIVSVEKFVYLRIGKYEMCKGILTFVHLEWYCSTSSTCSGSFELVLNYLCDRFIDPSAAYNLSQELGWFVANLLYNTAVNAGLRGFEASLITAGYQSPIPIRLDD